MPTAHVSFTLSDVNFGDNSPYHYNRDVALGTFKRWHEANEVFDICVRAQAQVLSAAIRIQLEAYKASTRIALRLRRGVFPSPLLCSQGGETAEYERYRKSH